MRLRAYSDLCVKGRMYGYGCFLTKRFERLLLSIAARRARGGHRRGRAERAGQGKRDGAGLLARAAPGLRRAGHG